MLTNYDISSGVSHDKVTYVGSNGRYRTLKCNVLPFFFDNNYRVYEVPECSLSINDGI